MIGSVVLLFVAARCADVGLRSQAVDDQSNTETPLGLWIAEEPDVVHLMLFKPGGKGVSAAYGRGTALGDHFTYSQSGENIIVTFKHSPEEPLECWLVGNTLRVESETGGELVHYWTNDDKHYELLAEENPQAKPRPLPPEAFPIRPPGLELTHLYYQSGATEAALIVGGDPIFEIGDETNAPQFVRDKLQALREAARPRIARFKVPEFDVSPDGRMIIVNGFDRESGKPIVFVWEDWRKADAVRELQAYARSGVRFSGSRYVKIGEFGILDRLSGEQIPVPVASYDFSLTPAGDWVALVNEHTTVRIGSLHDADVREFALGNYGGDIDWVVPGRYFAVQMVHTEMRIYSVNGEISDRVPGDVRFGGLLQQGRFFVLASGDCVLAEVDEDGKVTLGKTYFGRWRVPGRISPSGRYITCFNAASPSRPGSERWEIWRSPLASDDDPLPPRIPLHQNYWISWARQE